MLECSNERGQVGAHKLTRKALKALLSELVGRGPSREEVLLVLRPEAGEEYIQRKLKKTSVLRVNESARERLLQCWAELHKGTRFSAEFSGTS
jgi:hypothetical protein